MNEREARENLLRVYKRVLSEYSHINFIDYTATQLLSTEHDYLWRGQRKIERLLEYLADAEKKLDATTTNNQQL